MDQLDPSDPTTWDDDTLISRKELNNLFGNAAGRITNTRDFPHPHMWDRKKPLWTVAQVRQWEHTHCLYGSNNNRCTRRRAHDIDHLGLCDHHLHKARKILNRRTQ